MKKRAKFKAASQSGISYTAKTQLTPKLSRFFTRRAGFAQCSFEEKGRSPLASKRNAALNGLPKEAAFLIKKNGLSSRQQVKAVCPIPRRRS